MRLRRHGYTLVELMVASAILAVGLTVVMKSFTAGLASMRASEMRTIATMLAQQRLAEIAGASAIEDGSDQGAAEAPWEAFRWTSDISTLEELPSLKSVRVEVMWQSGTGYDSVSLSTVLRPPPEEDETGGTGTGAGL